MLATPLVINFFEVTRLGGDKWRNPERLVILGCTLVVTAITFYSDGALFLFLICPPLVWVGLRLGIRDTAAAVLISLITASIAAAHGHGPSEVLHITASQRPLFLELAYLCAYACILPIAASLETRRRLDADLARSLEFTGQILRNMQEIAFRTDAKARWSFLNPAWEDLTGYTVAESLGRASIQRIVLEDLKSVNAAYGRLKRGEVEELKLECRFHRKDGEIRDAELSIRAIRGPASAFLGTIGTIRDISKHLRYVQALEASESRFRHLCDTAPISIVRCDHQGVITYTNQRFELITLQPAGSLVGAHWQDVLGPGHPRLFDELAATLKLAHAVFDQEIAFRDSAGQQRWLTLTATGEFDETGRRTGYIAVVNDITQRKAAELELARRTSELRILTENVSDVIFRVGISGDCLYSTPSARDVLGLDPRDVTGLKLATMVHPEDRPAVADAFARLTQGEVSHYTITYRFLPPKADYIWLEANCRLLRDPAGQPREVIAALRDVTERKRLEFDLMDARLHAEDAVKTKSAFLANLSHEIRTPMNGVIGLTELLLSHDLEPTSRRYVELISESGATMMKLLSDILEIAKIDAGRLNLAHTEFDLHQCLANSLSLMSASAAGKQLALRLDIAPDVPRHMLGDSLRLRQVLANLLGNAIKFTATGHVDLVALRRGDELEIRIEDTGIGIDADAQPTVFEEFFQANAEIASAYGGTGLGLPISRRIAEAMGGTLMLASKRGEGTTLTLRIPASFGEPHAPGVAHLAQHAARPARAPLHILVAEDNRTNQIILTGMLRKLGHIATIANNGKEVLTLVEQADAARNPYDLILMDIQMPELSGIEATRALRSAGHDAASLRIIAVTASGYQEDIDGCLAAGMQSHIAKPIRLTDLAAALDAAGPGAGINNKAVTAPHSQSEPRITKPCAP